MAEFRFDSTTVDVVSLTPEGKAALLHIVQPEAWTGSDEQLISLQQKIHSYVQYALDGQMHRQYPETQNLSWRIVINSQSGPPDPRTVEMISDVRERVRGYGGDIAFAPLHPAGQ